MFSFITLSITIEVTASAVTAIFLAWLLIRKYAK